MIGCDTNCAPRGLLMVVGVLLLSSTGMPFPGHARQGDLLRFAVADQFDRAHTDAELRGRILLIVGADRRGSRYQERGIEALRASVEDQAEARAIRIVEVADLRGVPFFVKGSVKKKFPSDRRQWVLMDWKGVFAKSYRFESEKCNILLFDRTGSLLHQAAVSELDREALEKIRRTLDALLAAERIAPPPAARE